MTKNASKKKSKTTKKTQKKQTKKKVGRPRKKFQWEELDKICMFDGNLMDAVELMNVSKSTIQNNIKKKFGIDFTTYKSQKLATTRMALKKKAIQRSLGQGVERYSERMHMFALKNLCDWKEKTEVDTSEDTKKVIQLAYSIPPKKKDK